MVLKSLKKNYSSLTGNMSMLLKLMLLMYEHVIKVWERSEIKR